jgi:hypothetical protein
VIVGRVILQIRLIAVAIRQRALRGLRDVFVLRRGMLLLLCGGAEEAKGPVGEVKTAEDDDGGKDLCIG